MLSKQSSRLSGYIKVYLDLVWWVVGAILVVLVVGGPWFVARVPQMSSVPRLALTADFTFPELQEPPPSVGGEGPALKGKGEVYILTRSILHVISLNHIP